MAHDGDDWAEVTATDHEVLADSAPHLRAEDLSATASGTIVIHEDDEVPPRPPSMRLRAVMYALLPLGLLAAIAVVARLTLG